MDGDMSGAQGTYLALASSLVLLLQRGLLPLFIPLGTPTSGKGWRVGCQGHSAPAVPGKARAGSGAIVIITGMPRIYCKSNSRAP